jgi:hypothetical protein
MRTLTAPEATIPETSPALASHTDRRRQRRGYGRAAFDGPAIEITDAVCRDSVQRADPTDRH